MNQKVKELLQKTTDEWMITQGVFDEILIEVILNDVLDLIDEHRVKFNKIWIEREHGTNLAPGAEWIYKEIKSRYGLK